MPRGMGKSRENLSHVVDSRSKDHAHCEQALSNLVHKELLMREIVVGSQYKSYLNVQEQLLKRVRFIHIVEGETNSLSFQLLTLK